jgi:L,D-peptidoglycan transpeptidase YkuD (ErfK/YbiS/YcfS/YnhG family)
VLVASLLTAAVTATCPSNLANGLSTAPEASQLITVEASGARTTYATLRTWRRVGRCWRHVGGPYPARVGRNGLRRNRREGDGTTPIGTFGIGPVMYGNLPNPGVKFRYRRVVCGDWWNEDPASPTYNSFRHVACGRRPTFRVSGPGMWQSPRAYPYLAVVEFNMHPVIPGRGSGIFLHAQTGGPTNGCISLRRAHLVRVLRWLSPRASPRITIGTLAGLRA